MTTLVITRGAPASGKTTWARKWVSEDEEGRARVNRDDLRQTLYGRDAPLERHHEETLTVAQQAAVHALLTAGKDVVVDDCHTAARYVKAWGEIAADAGADLEVNASFADVPVEELVRRDTVRGKNEKRSVGEDVIRSMHARLSQSLKTEPMIGSAIEDSYRYEPDKRLPSAWMVDLDGTLALMNGRGPFEWDRVFEDTLNVPVYHVLHALEGMGHRIVFMSGRDSVCRPDTWRWIVEKAGLGSALVKQPLYMRPEGDRRKDSTVKLELFREYVAPNWNVLGVLDDRDSVVAMWRRIGLPCFQVAPGAF